MRAMVLHKIGEPLQLQDVAVPKPNSQQVLINVHACGICRTDLHILDGELNQPNLPLIPGHQIVGTITDVGSEVKNLKKGQRIGVPWLGGSCGHCRYCKAGQENLCDNAVFTGYQINGGLAEYCVTNANFCFPIPENYPNDQAAPLLCAGLIGFRCLSKAEDAKHLGIYGFGAAGHLLVQVAVFQGRQVYVFTKPGDTKTQQFAKQLGAVWAGGSNDAPPELLDAAIIFAPAGELVPQALRAVAKGGKVICGGIHMSDIPSFPYDILWGERCVCSVANLTRHDGEEFLAIAPRIPIKTEVHTYPLEQANEALADLRAGRYTGAYVVKI